MTLLKPKAVGSRYATVKILDIIEPRVKSFDEAKELVTKEFKIMKTQELLDKRAKELLSKDDSLKLESGFISQYDYRNYFPGG